jgi:putative cell wall-binding protein
MKDEKIDITLNQEDVQNIIDCYEKDIELIEKLKEKNEIYKSTMKGQHRRIEELKQAKKVSKQIQKERNKRLRKENELLKERIDKAYYQFYDMFYHQLGYKYDFDEFDLKEIHKLEGILKGEKE